MSATLPDMEWSLTSNFCAKPISKEAYDSFRATYEPIIFPNRFDLSCSGALSPEEHAALDRLSKNTGTPYEVRTGFYCGKELVGWSYGYQISKDTFRMATSGIRAEYQRKGVYSAYLTHLAAHLKEEGFQILFSRHYATDNQVIIPKLRFGFLVSGFELTDEFGLLLRLSYYFNPVRRQALHMRSGLYQPDDAVKALIRRY